MKKNTFETVMKLFVDVDLNLTYQQILQKIIPVYKNQLRCDFVYFYDSYYHDAKRFIYPDSAFSKLQNPEFFDHLDSGVYAREKFVYDHYCNLHYYAFQLPEFGWLVLINKYQLSEALLRHLQKPINYLTSKLALASKIKANEKLVNRLNTHTELVNEILSGIIIVNMDGSLFYLNRIAKKWTGIDDENFSEYKISDIEDNFRGHARQTWSEHIEELKQVDNLKVEGRIRNIQNDRITFTDASLKYFSINHREFVIANLIDTTEQLISKKKLSEETELQDLLLRIAGDYLNINYSKIEQSIQRSLGELGSYVNADRVYIFDYDFKNETCSNSFEWCANGISPEIDNLQDVPIKFFPEWIEKHKKKEPFIINNVDELPDSGEQGLKAILSAQHIKSLITLPMLDGEHLLGFVGFDSVYSFKKYSTREIKLLSLFSHMLVNIHLRKQWENNFRTQRKRYISIINDVNIGLMELDHELNIRFINNHLCNLLGYQEHELIHLNCLETFLDEESQGSIYNKLLSIKEGENITLELYPYTKEKVKKPFMMSMCRLENKSGKIKGFLGTFIDLANQKSIEKNLIKAKEKAEIASKAKETFLANISHEMRTPLHIINGTVSEVLKTQLDKEQSYLLQRGNFASVHLLNLVNNVLDIAKIKSDEIYLDYKCHILYNSTKEVYEMLKILANDNQIDLNLHFNLKKESEYLYNAQKLNQVLINLISNAIKFTKEGSVDIYIEAVKDFEAYSVINFKVKDTGIGMSKEFQSELFENFKTENNFGFITQNGTGLGMPISKKLVNLMGGEITVQSKKNRGSEFSFDLRLKKVSTIIDDQELERDDVNLEGKHLLVVEDNLMSQVLIKKKLKRLGANISLSNDGLEAIEILKEKGYDLILVDMQMPNLNGLETAKVIREDLQLKTPIIVITANVFSRDIDKFKSYDIEDYVLKPFKDEELFNSITKALNIESSNLSNKISSKKVKKLYSTERLLEVVNGDVKFLNELIITFQTILKETLSEMQEYIDSGNLEALLRLQHKIKPSLIDLEVYDVVTEIKALEQRNISSFNEAKENFEEIYKILKKLYSQLKDFEESTLYVK